jgi:hypothetical protein
MRRNIGRFGESERSFWAFLVRKNGVQHKLLTKLILDTRGTVYKTICHISGKQVKNQRGRKVLFFYKTFRVVVKRRKKRSI